VDESGSQLNMLLWKSAASESVFDRGTVIAVKSGMLKSSIFQGVTSITLGLTMNTMFWPNPAITRAEELTVWMNSKIAAIN